MPHTMKRSPLVIVLHSPLHHTLDIFLSLGFTKFPEFWSTYYLITCTFIVYILILIMLCYWHYSICHILFNREALLRDNTIVTRYRRQVAQLLIALIITFFILILPYKIWAIIHQNITYEQFLEIGFHRHSLLSTITRALLYLNSAVNPFFSRRKSIKSFSICLFLLFIDQSIALFNSLDEIPSEFSSTLWSMSNIIENSTNISCILWQRISQTTYYIKCPKR